MKHANSSAAATRERSGSDTLSGSGQSHRPSSATARTILLIDDNDDVARAVEIAFRMAGHSVERAENAQDAYSRLALRRFDAGALLDPHPGGTRGPKDDAKDEL